MHYSRPRYEYLQDLIEFVVRLVKRIVQSVRSARKRRNNFTKKQKRVIDAKVRIEPLAEHTTTQAGTFKYKGRFKKTQQVQRSIKLAHVMI